MPKLSENLSRFELSPIIEISQMAIQLRAQGHKIFDLSSGEPDMVSEDFICQAAHDAIDAGETKYTETDGTMTIKSAISRKFLRDGHPEYSASQIVVGGGAKPLIANVLMALLDAGDEVVIPGPCWSSHPGMVLALGGNPVVIDCPVEAGYKVDAVGLRKALTNKSRVLILCNPNNPTGAVYSAEEQRVMAQVLTDYPDVWVLADEIYADIVFDEKSHISFAVAAPELAGRTITVNGLSKGYAMTGWRVGFAAGPDRVMQAVRKIMSQVAGSPSTISQLAGIAALDGKQDGIQVRCTAYQARRDAVLECFEGISQFSVARPEGAFYVYVDCTGAVGQQTPQGAIINSSIDLAKYFLEFFGVAIVPGEAFNAETSFRMSIASSMDVLQGACAAMIKACQGLSEPAVTDDRAKTG